MPPIETVLYEKATGRLKDLYDRIISLEGRLDHIMMAHSLPLHTMHPI